MPRRISHLRRRGALYAACLSFTLLAGCLETENMTHCPYQFDDSGRDAKVTFFQEPSGGAVRFNVQSDSYEYNTRGEWSYKVYSDRTEIISVGEPWGDPARTPPSGEVTGSNVKPGKILRLEGTVKIPSESVAGKYQGACKMV